MADRCPEKPALKVLLCSPRGFCAGVVRAIESVERALAIYGAAGLCAPRDRAQPLCGREPARQGRDFRRGTRARSPTTGAPVIFSAHGVPRSVPEEAARRNLFALDATCPLVTKVHREAEIHHRRGREIVLIGHAGHPEVVGTMGQLPPGASRWSRRWRTWRTSRRATPSNLAYVTQTTLSVEDTAAIVERAQARASRRSSARTRKTSATPPPTARRRSSRWRRWSTP